MDAQPTRRVIADAASIASFRLANRDFLISPPPIKKRWSYFIRKVYETDPLTCPKCQGEMRIISFIDQPDVIKKIGRFLLLQRGLFPTSRRLRLKKKFLSLSREFLGSRNYFQALLENLLELGDHVRSQLEKRGYDSFQFFSGQWVNIEVTLFRLR
jgi:hypothetical protein